MEQLGAWPITTVGYHQVEHHHQLSELEQRIMKIRPRCACEDEVRLLITYCDLLPSDFAE